MKRVLINGIPIRLCPTPEHLICRYFGKNKFDNILHHIVFMYDARAKKVIRKHAWELLDIIKSDGSWAFTNKGKYIYLWRGRNPDLDELAETIAHEYGHIKRTSPIPQSNGEQGADYHQQVIEFVDKAMRHLGYQWARKKD